MSRRRVRHWSVRSRVRVALSFVVLAVGSAVASPAPRQVLEVVSPQPGQRVGPAGLDVMLRFRSDDGAATPATFRALLNGADVTDQLTTAENGAVGRLHSLLDGDNVLRVEVFVRAGGLFSWLDPGWWSEQSCEIHVRYRRPLDADQA